MLFLLFTIFASAFAQNELRVNLSNGQIEGYLIAARNGAQGYGYLGIPYARPPVGELRFGKPTPPEPWSGVLECKKYKSNCWQIHTTMAGEFFTGIEDCLYLNVFRGMKCTKQSLCPVMYYIHGGGFNYDTPAAFSPQLLIENFASRGLVVVSIAYRLNAFGFWSTGGEEAVGNYGMHDMITGLEWVQREIQNFGGDNQRVTIMGHSSGGQSVSLLSLSPITKGLFYQAIMLSGNNVGENTIQNDLSLYRILATNLNCTDEILEPWREWTDSKKRRGIVECMRKIDADTLGNEYLRLLETHPYGHSGPRYDGPDGIFPKRISQLIADRRPLSALTGTTKRELGKDIRDYVNATSETVMTACVRVIKPLRLRNERQVISECQGHYALRPLITKEYNERENCTWTFWTLQMEKILSTMQYHAPCYKESTSLLRKGAAVFLYSFDYTKIGQEDFGPGHAFDLTFLLGVHMFSFDERDLEIQKIYANLIANFIKYAHPTPNLDASDTWIPLKPFGFNYYSIDLPEPRMKSDFHKDDILFWNYRIPLMENARDPHAQKMLNFMREMDDNFHGYDEKEVSLTNWQMAFWVILAVLVSVVCATLALFVRFYYIGKRGRMGNVEESQSLLEDNDQNRNDSYSTFRQ